MEVSRHITTHVCRGTQLKQPGTCGFSKELRCPFHGWTWSLEGTLVDLPGAGLPHVTKSHNYLK